MVWLGKLKEKKKLYLIRVKTPNYQTPLLFHKSVLFLEKYIYSDGKESDCSAGDPGLIPGLGRSPGEGNATHSSILAWKIWWTEEPGGLQSMESQDLAWLSN